MGRANESVAVNLTSRQLDSGAPVPAADLPMAHLDGSGRATLRAPLTFSGSRWILLTASLATPDRLGWAAQRSQLIHLPPPAVAQILTLGPSDNQADEIVRLALDPSQGSQPDWPIALRAAGPVHGDEDLLVGNLTQWPDDTRVHELSDFVRQGGTLVLFAQPGLEQEWAALPTEQRQLIESILPGDPVMSPDSGPYVGSVSRPNDPLLSGVGTDESASGGLRLDRIVPMQIADPAVQTILRRRVASVVEAKDRQRAGLFLEHASDAAVWESSRLGAFPADACELRPSAAGGRSGIERRDRPSPDFDGAV